MSRNQWNKSPRLARLLLPRSTCSQGIDRRGVFVQFIDGPRRTIWIEPGGSKAGATFPETISLFQINAGLYNTVLGMAYKVP